MSDRYFYRRSLLVWCCLCAWFALAIPPLRAEQTANRPDLVEQFRDRGFGLFIHWGVDGVLGGVISHSLVGASPEYQTRFFTELPSYFNPTDFHPDQWAALAKLAGFRYVVFTTKHHAGFCMWNTQTTPFSVMHTPFGRDLFREVVDAFRKQGLAIGIYFSPDDFWWLHQHGITINRHVKGIYPQDIPEFMQYTRAQLHELLTQYGPIDYFFFDGPAEQLTAYAWQLQPNLVITRGVMETPEQYTPGIALPSAWEGNLTMGTEWPWKPTNETYKSGPTLINTIIETRAKGGNMLLNVGPKPDGSWPVEQEGRLREIALWNFVNQEAITNTRPWVITNEGEIWFTRAKGSATVYAFLTNMAPWKLGTKRTIVLRSVRSTSKTQVSVLGQSDAIVEYQPEIQPRTTWVQKPDGLTIDVTRAQRLYTNGQWPNAITVKLTNVEAAIVPPKIQTMGATWDVATKSMVLHGNLLDLGKAPMVQVGFQYRLRPTGLDVAERVGTWIDSPLTSQETIGNYTADLKTLQAGQQYEFRARVKHPAIELFGAEKTFKVPASSSSAR